VLFRSDKNIILSNRMNDNKKLEEMEENFEQTENSGAGGMK
jgi:hypothetical protein